MVPRCGWPRRVPLIVLYAKPKALASAQSKKSGHCRTASVCFRSEEVAPATTNGNGGGGTVRDRLCQLIRQHQLDPNLVKAYATDFCSVKALRDATREQVETFVTHLADWAEKDRNALLCQLNSYLGQKAGAA